jgi:hypothetical protein
MFLYAWKDPRQAGMTKRGGKDDDDREEHHHRNLTGGASPQPEVDQTIHNGSDPLPTTY